MNNQCRIRDPEAIKPFRQGFYLIAERDTRGFEMS